MGGQRVPPGIRGERGMGGPARMPFPPRGFVPNGGFPPNAMPPIRTGLPQKPENQAEKLKKVTYFNKFLFF